MHTFLKKIPKVELHVHLEGSVKATTFVELAKKHKVEIPTFEKPEDLYDYPDIYKFLEMYDLVAEVVRDQDDFHRITYETLKEAAEHNVRYREMFWSPMAHMNLGISYDTAIDGIIAGIRDAKKDFNIECRMIANINRMESPEKGYEMVEAVLDNGRDELIGIGLDYAEANNPPEKF